MRERLKWLAAAKLGALPPAWLKDNTWSEGIREVASEALAHIERLEGFNAQLMETLTWRPIAEAPIPPATDVGPYWTFPCLLQTERGTVGEGFARWVEDGRMKGAREACVLRWYLGAADRGRDTRVCHDPKYFMPLPAKRED